MGTPTEVAKVSRIFERLGAEEPVAALSHTHAVYEFDIDDGGRWFVSLDGGKATVDDEERPPDCVITCSAAELVALAQGGENLMTAFLQGKVKLAGDVALALDLRRLLPVAA